MLEFLLGKEDSQDAINFAPAGVLLKGRSPLLQSYPWPMLFARRQHDVLQSFMAGLPQQKPLLAFLADA